MKQLRWGLCALLATSCLVIMPVACGSSEGGVAVDEAGAAGEALTNPLRGRLTRDDRPYTRSGYTGEIVSRPARGVAVFLIDHTGAVADEAVTDAEGAFVFQRPANGGEYVVRAMAVLADFGFSVGVVANERRQALYSLRSRVVSADEDFVELHAGAASPMAGALNVVDTVWDAAALIAAHTERRPPQLTFTWSPGRSFPCGSCYRENNIDLGGGYEDPDEFDDDIILHEFGHFFFDTMSRDSNPGGRHNGERLDPLLAFGEGAATFFSAMVRNSAEYTDYRLGWVRHFDIEHDSDPDYWGTADGLLTGEVSEYLVAGLMWDLLDPPDDDDQQIPIETHFAALLDGLPALHRRDVGIPGVDLADWLSAIGCSQHTREVATEGAQVRRYPWRADAACAHKPAIPRSISLLSTGGGIQVNWRRDDPPGPIDFTVQRIEGASAQTSTVTCRQSPCHVAATVPANGVVFVWDDRTPRVVGSLIGEGMVATEFASSEVLLHQGIPIVEFPSTRQAMDGRLSDNVTRFEALRP